MDDASTATATLDRHLTAAATTLAVELQECRSESLGAASEAMRSWFDGRARGLERALELLHDYQRRA